MYPNQPIKTWAAEDRPREKLLQRGIAALTDAELVAILLATGTREKSALDLARDILEQTGGLSQLASSDVKQLTRIHGIGPAKALTLVATFELARRKASHFPDRVKVTHIDIAYGQFRRIADETQEVFCLMLLNRSNEVISLKEMFRGGTASTVVDPKLIFKEALSSSASAMIVAHNHPSGNLKPSDADKAITKKLVAGGHLLDIVVLDHLIISQRGYFSFANEGLI